MQQAKNGCLQPRCKARTAYSKIFNTYEGFSPGRVEKMRGKYGENRITYQNGDSLLKRLFKAFINPFYRGAACARRHFVCDGRCNGRPGDKDAVSVIIVLAMVLISGTPQFVQKPALKNQQRS